MKRMIGAVACTVLAMGCSVFGPADEHADIADEPAPPRDAAPPPPAAEVVTGTPTDSELVEKLGVFVTEQGSDDGDGSRAHPYLTLAKGIASGKELGKRVYVCSGTFKETVVIEDGIPMVGGLDCSTPSEWKVGTARTRIEAPSSPAVRADDVTHATRFEGFEVVAPDAKEPSGSSIGLLASHAPGLSIVNARIAAGNGAPGQAGSEGIQLVQSSPSIDGVKGLSMGQWCTDTVLDPHCAYDNFGNKKTPVRDPGAAAGTSQCVGAPGHDGESGGRGGSAGLYQYVNGVGWLDDNLNGGGAGKGEVRSGANGAQGTNGASGDLGVFSVGGYTAADGAAGSDGAPGKGGSGGDGARWSQAQSPAQAPVDWRAFGGGGGGAGGCPGLAGTPGKGGGASIAAVLLDSPIAFEGSELVSATGGAGGRGTFGSSPTKGGYGGFWGGGNVATSGANGGNGGAAGVSGSGAGGPSFAIAHSASAAPKLTTTTTRPGNGGTGVPAETTSDALGNTKTLPASATGLSKDVYAF